MVYIYSWIPAYKEIIKKIPDYKDRQPELIQILRDIGVNVNEDEDRPGNRVPLTEVDPFTFLFFLGKHRNDLNKVNVLRKLCEKWNIDLLVNDVCGIPSANAQKLWMFSWQYARTNEIALLWDFFEKAIIGSIADSDFQNIIAISNVGKQKVTEGLFLVDNERYLCLNGKVKPFVQSFGVDTEFENFTQLQAVYAAVKKAIPLAFHEISFEGYINTSYANRTPNFFRVGTTAGEGGESELQNMLANNIATIGWPELGDLNSMDPLNKGNLIRKFQEQGYYVNDNKTASRKAGEIMVFFNEIAPGDYVIAADGASIHAIGKVISDHYIFNPGARFPHCRCVKWIKSAIDNFSIDEGLRTTIWKYYAEGNITAIKNYLNLEASPIINSDKLPNSKSMSLNQILYGPPGTGKTFHSISYAVAIIEDESPDKIIEEANIDRVSVKKRYDDYVDQGLIVFTTFHQNMSYEDFIEGIKPLAPEKDQDIKYDIEDGIFKGLCSRAESNWFSSNQKDISGITFEDVFDEFKEHWESNRALKIAMKTIGKEFTITGFTNKSIYFKKANGGEGHTLSINTLKDIYYEKRKAWENGVGIYYPGIIEKLKGITIGSASPKTKANNYVIIIDEINRGNVSQIFGELITLIEDDKRIFRPESIKITLPYSKDQFGVPPNLYIIGTMNTADRSVEALDTALRRRFSFVPKMPEESRLEKTTDGLDLPKILQTINTRLRVLKDNDHTIGHAWLWSVTDTEQLRVVFENKILPLLQEYFYNDYEKLGLVLGDAFFKPHTQISSNIFASFSGGNGLAGQYDQSWQYQLKSANELTTADFKTLEIQHTQPAADETE